MVLPPSLVRILGSYGKNTPEVRFGRMSTMLKGVDSHPVHRWCAEEMQNCMAGRNGGGEAVDGWGLSF